MNSPSHRFPWLLFALVLVAVSAAAAAAAASLCRWAMGLVAVPVTVYALAALVRMPRSRALAHAAVAGFSSWPKPGHCTAGTEKG